MRVLAYRGPDGATGIGELADGDVHRLSAATMIEWLSGRGRERSGERRALDAVELLAPVPEPPSLRDFYAFEGHVAAGFARRGSEIPPAWYEAPAFYFSNPASILGPDQGVVRPAGVEELDFEVEVAAVLGSDGEIAGFTLMNDWSARDVQRREVTVGLGPHKGKDFATSLGPWLVTPDELPYSAGRLELEVTVTVNGREVARTRAGEQHFPWPELVAHAARGTRLRAGDVLGSGTLTGGCLLELGPLDGERWIEPGDVVVMSAPELGALTTPVA